MKPDSEKRQAPRAKKEIPLKVSAEEADFISQTQNISSTGAFFRIEKAIPLMSRLAITLLVPTLGKKKTTKKIICNGVVVRCEPVDVKNPAGEHNVAIYFTSLKEPDKKSLAKYVKQVLETPS